MNRYKVSPIFKYSSSETPRSFDLRIRVPGSKSISARALLLGALSDGPCTLNGIGLNDDSRHFIECLKTLGFECNLSPRGDSIVIYGRGGQIPKKNVSIYAGSAGTAARFLTALLGLGSGNWRINASSQMKRRPMKPLTDALEYLGCKIEYEEEPGHLPISIRGCRQGFPKSSSSDKMKSGSLRETEIDISSSSQFLSALLLASPALAEKIRIKARGRHGLSYVKMSIELMKSFGLDAEIHEIGEDVPERGSERIIICTADGSRPPRSGTYEIEPDISSASYFYAMAAISGGRVLVERVHSDSLQGDIAFLDILVKMGCSMKENKEGITLQGPACGSLMGIDVDMSACSDQALTLAAIAPFCEGPVIIRGIRHIRFQECDRIAAVTGNLRAMGIEASYDEGRDKLSIYPGEPAPALVKTYSDHRMAMAFSLTGLGAEGITIDNPMCCAKTFEGYFDILEDIIRAYTKR